MFTKVKEAIAGKKAQAEKGKFDNNKTPPKKRRSGLCGTPQKYSNRPNKPLDDKMSVDKVSIDESKVSVGEAKPQEVTSSEEPVVKEVEVSDVVVVQESTEDDANQSSEKDELNASEQGEVHEPVEEVKIEDFVQASDSKKEDSETVSPLSKTRDGVMPVMDVTGVEGENVDDEPSCLPVSEKKSEKDDVDGDEPVSEIEKELNPSFSSYDLNLPESFRNFASFTQPADEYDYSRYTSADVTNDYISDHINSIILANIDQVLKASAMEGVAMPEEQDQVKKPEAHLLEEQEGRVAQLIKDLEEKILSDNDAFVEVEEEKVSEDKVSKMASEKIVQDEVASEKIVQDEVASEKIVDDEVGEDLECDELAKIAAEDIVNEELRESAKDEGSLRDELDSAVGAVETPYATAETFNNTDHGNEVPCHFNIPGLHLGELFAGNIVGPTGNGLGKLPTVKLNAPSRMISCPSLVTPQKPGCSAKDSIGTSVAQSNFTSNAGSNLNSGMEPLLSARLLPEIRLPGIAGAFANESEANDVILVNGSPVKIGSPVKPMTPVNMQHNMQQVGATPVLTITPSSAVPVQQRSETPLQQSNGPTPVQACQSLEHQKLDQFEQQLLKDQYEQQQREALYAAQQAEFTAQQEQEERYIEARQLEAEEQQQLLNERIAVEEEIIARAEIVAEEIARREEMIAEEPVDEKFYTGNTQMNAVDDGEEELAAGEQ